MVESPAKEQPTDWGHVHFAEDRHARTMSMHSDDTVFDHSPRPLTPPSPAAPVTVASLRARVVALAPGLITVVDRSLLILGYTCALSGIAVYTGTCRERYLNGSAPSLPSSFPSRTQTDPPLRARFSCLAHTIKGSVFFWYGLLSFARYLGAYRALGWAWNRRRRDSRGRRSGRPRRSRRWSFSRTESRTFVSFPSPYLCLLFCCSRY